MIRTLVFGVEPLTNEQSLQLESMYLVNCSVASKDPIRVISLYRRANADTDV